MNFQRELENIARDPALQSPENGVVPDVQTIRRYQNLFDMTHEEAVARIKEHESGLREHTGKQKQNHSQPQTPKTRGPVAFLVQLSAPLLDPETIMKIAGLHALPDTVTGTDEQGCTAAFCRIEGPAREAILAHLANAGTSHRPTLIQITQAEKDLSATSMAPFLGFESTLPQFRATTSDEAFSPAQDEYPVWYFVYGMLADPSELKLILNLDCEPQYRPALVKGGRLLSLKAMVDAPRGVGDESIVEGKAYCVGTKKAEDSMRYSVTEKFEVVRCRIRLVDAAEDVFGLTFRFIG